MHFVKYYLLLLLGSYTKQDCAFHKNTFLCEETEIESIAYDFNSKKPEDIEILSVEISNSNYSVIDDFFNFLDKSSKEKLMEIKITNSNVKKVNDNAFEQYKSLKVLDLSNNQIEEMSFVTHLPKSIVELHFSNNSFTHIDDVFMNLNNLRYIDLSFCNLDEVDFTVFNEIISLDLVNVSSNNIQNSVSKKYLKNIKCVDLSHNSLTTYENIPSFCLDFSYTNMSGYKWYNVSEKNVTVFVDKFYYISNKNLYINATNVQQNLLDIKINYLNISEYKSNISDLELTKVKITKELILTGSNIPSLDKDVYNFKQLFYDENPNTTFDLSNNSIAEISEMYFAKYNLGILNLCYNSMKFLKVNVFYEAYFGELLLCHSGIDNIHDSTFDGLIVKKLNLSYNKLDKVNFLANVKNLQHLDLSYNLIKLVNVNTFSNLNDLEIINLSNNLISSLDSGLFKTTKLFEINLRNNNLTVIKSLSFSYLPNLSQLLLEGNHITVIETNAFISLPKLVSLNLANMSLERLEPNSFSDLTGIKIIYLNNNNISILPTNIFVGVPNLSNIYLYNNNINSLSALSQLNLNLLAINVGDQLSGNFNIPQLRLLYLKDSNVGVLSNSFFLGLYNLRELHLENSVIASYEPNALRGLFRLQYLDPQLFSKVTILKTYSFKDLISLQQLDLSGLNVKVIEPEAFYGLIKLEKLLLNNNNIVILNDNVFVGLRNVRTLDLSGNNISQVCVRTFVGLGGIRELLLNQNSIVSIPLGIFQNLGTLEVLNLARNRIGQINVGTFSQLNNLKYLDLSFNEIARLCGPVLYPLKNLEKLYLTGNYLHSVNEFVVGYLPKLQLVDINQNRLNCDDLVLILNSTNTVTFHSQNGQNFETENINGIICVNTCRNN